MRRVAKSSRRSFFRGLAGTAVSATAGRQVTQEMLGETLFGIESLSSPSNADEHYDGGYWEEIRQQFMLEGGFGYLNNGTLGPTPRPVYEAMVEHWRLMAVNPHENSNIIQHHEREVLRFKAAAFLDVSPDEIAITRNTTEGNTILAHGVVDLKQGDEILISAFEHNSCKQTWLREAKRRGYVVKEVVYNNPPDGHAEILNAFEDAITARTRIIHIAHPTPGYGCLQPLKELAELAHRRNMLCFIDGAHCPGMVRFSLREWDVDAFACNSHKWLCGPAGTGLLYIRRDRQDRIAPNISQLAEELVGARKYAYSMGRRPWPVVAALSNTLDFHLAIGRDRTEQRLRALGSYLRKGALEIPGAKLYTSTDPALSAGISSIGIQGVSGRRIAEYLRQRYNIFVPGGGDRVRFLTSASRTVEPIDRVLQVGPRVRFSTNYYNTFEQVDRVLQALRELASDAA